MFYRVTFVFCLLCWCQIGSTDQLSNLQHELDQCKQALKSLESESYMGRVCQWISNPGKSGKDTLKTTVHNLLHTAQLEHRDNHEGPSSTDVFELDLVLKLTSRDLVALRRFLLTDQGEEHEIQEILKHSFSIKTGAEVKRTR